MPLISLPTIAARLRAQVPGVNVRVGIDELRREAVRGIVVADGKYHTADEHPLGQAARQTVYAEFVVSCFVPDAPRRGAATTALEALRLKVRRAVMGWAPAGVIRAVASSGGSAAEDDGNAVIATDMFNYLCSFYGDGLAAVQDGFAPRYIVPVDKGGTGLAAISGNSKYFGTNANGDVGVYDLPVATAPSAATTWQSGTLQLDNDYIYVSFATAGGGYEVERTDALQRITRHTAMSGVAPTTLAAMQGLTYS